MLNDATSSIFIPPPDKMQGKPNQKYTQCENYPTVHIIADKPLAS